MIKVKVYLVNNGQYDRKDRVFSEKEKAIEFAIASVKDSIARRFKEMHVISPYVSNLTSKVAVKDDTVTGYVYGIEQFPNDEPEDVTVGTFTRTIREKELG